MREDEIGLDMLELLERLLDRLTVVRHVRIPETVHDVSPGPRPRGTPRRWPAPGLPGCPPPRAPPTSPRRSARASGRAASHRTDLDVAGVEPIASTRRSGASPPKSGSESIRLASARVPRAARADARARGQTRGALPAAVDLDRVHRPEEALYGNATTSPRGIRRANVSSTSSSPGSIQSSTPCGIRRNRR